jgi:molecular chaperone Hsp33
MLNVHGQGRCAITLDPGTACPASSPTRAWCRCTATGASRCSSLSQVLEHYMLQSEQLDTRLVLAANDEVAAGLLIQRLPVKGGQPGRRGAGQRDEDQIGRNEDYNRIALLAGTLTRRRTAWEETLRVFEPQAARFACRCSRERVRHMLRGLGADEVNGLIAERGEAEVGCDFCGAVYRFDPVDVGSLFTAGREAPPASGELH